MLHSSRDSQFENQIENLLVLENDLIQIGRKFQLELKRSSPGIVWHLQTLTGNALLLIEKNLNDLKRCWLSCEFEKIDPWDDNEFLTLSMRSMNLSFPRDFIDKMKTGDLVEGYDSERFQVFRNMRFMETSAYSLLEVQSFAWPMLFQRSDQITGRLIQYCDDVLWENNCTVDLEIPEHIICEIRTSTPQSCAVRFRHMAPLFSGPNRRFGILVSCQARIVDNPTSSH